MLPSLATWVLWHQLIVGLCTPFYCEEHSIQRTAHPNPEQAWMYTYTSAEDCEIVRLAKEDQDREMAPILRRYRQAASPEEWLDWTQTFFCEPTLTEEMGWGGLE